MEEEIQTNRAKAGIEVGSCLDCFILLDIEQIWSQEMQSIWYMTLITLRITK